MTKDPEVPKTVHDLAAELGVDTDLLRMFADSFSDILLKYC